MLCCCCYDVVVVMLCCYVVVVVVVVSGGGGGVYVFVFVFGGCLRGQPYRLNETNLFKMDECTIRFILWFSFLTSVCLWSIFRSVCDIYLNPVWNELDSGSELLQNPLHRPGQCQKQRRKWQSEGNDTWRQQRLARSFQRPVEVVRWSQHHLYSLGTWPASWTEGELCRSKLWKLWILGRLDLWFNKSIYLSPW